MLYGLSVDFQSNAILDDITLGEVEKIRTHTAIRYFHWNKRLQKEIKFKTRSDLQYI